MRYKNLYKIALDLEAWLEGKIKIPNRNLIATFLSERLGKPVKFIGRGAFKVSFQVASSKKILVLKVGRPAYIEQDFKSICEARAIPRFGIYILRYYWKTAHCMLQRYAGGPPDEKQVLKLKKRAKIHGFRDVRKANAGSLPNGKTKIFDLNGKSFCPKGEAV